MPLRLASAGLGAVALVLAAAWAIEPAPPARTPWLGSRLVGSPDPAPPLKLVNAFPQVKFDHPTLLAQPPGGGRFFVAEQGGKVYSFAAGGKPDLCLDIAADLKNLKLTPGATHFESVYGLAFHPRFAENRQCFVCYTVHRDGKPNLADGTRVSRFAMTRAEPPRIDPASEELLFTFLQGGHNGGDLHFGPDGMLYVTAGDAATPNPPDEFKTGQDITDLLSSVLRVDVDRRDAGKTYAVPPDNPFVGTVIDGKPARGEVWAYGFRNPWRVSFDRATGDLWAGDVGWELWELVHKVTRGGNYGWSAVEGRQPVNTTLKLGPTPVTPPAIEVPHTEGASVTGGYVYRGAKFPSLVGRYVFGDWVTKKIWAAAFAADGTPELREIVAPTARVVAFGQDAAGELYLLDYDNGTVHTFAANDAAAADPAEFPRALSATGLFADAATHAVAAGVVPFEINAPQWQDGATSRHFLAMPGTAPVRDYAERKQIPGNVNWNWYRLHFPAGTALVKTITLPPAGDAPPRRVETQVLLFDGQFWTGYTYAWRDDQSDADLVPADGAEKVVSFPDPVTPGATRQRPWTFAGRSQCQQCHHSWAEHTLAFNPEQLHRGGQLTALVAAGVLERRTRDEKPLPSYSAEELAKERKLVNPHDPAAPLDKRAQSYLHANCGHCHRFGGGGAVDFELHAFTDWQSKKLVNAPPTRGTFDLPDPKIIAPGDPDRSVVAFRMAKFGRGRMPHVGSEVVDEAGVGLVRRWIAALGGKELSETPPPLTAFAPADLDARPQELARAVGTRAAGRFTPEILAAAAKLPDGPRRDLFDGYLPDDGRPRRLGTSPRPKAILALAGDAARGKALFTAERSQCLKCHQLDGQGAAIGPDLSVVGKARTPAHLLESLLDPSRRVEPPYQAVLVSCHDGRTFTALVVKKDADAVTLRDGENRETTLKRDDIDTLTPARESLMPAGLLAHFTPQQAADLLAFLAGRK